MLCLAGQAFAIVFRTNGALQGGGRGEHMLVGALVIVLLRRFRELYAFVDLFLVCREETKCARLIASLQKLLTAGLDTYPKTRTGLLPGCRVPPCIGTSADCSLPRWPNCPAPPQSRAVVVGLIIKGEKMQKCKLILAFGCFPPTSTRACTYMLLQSRSSRSALVRPRTVCSS